MTESSYSVMCLCVCVWAFARVCLFQSIPMKRNGNECLHGKGIYANRRDKAAVFIDIRVGAPWLSGAPTTGPAAAAQAGKGPVT